MLDLIDIHSRKWPLSIVMLAALLFLSSVVKANSAFIDSIPDFTQTQLKGTAFGNGQQYCGPVAVSNALVWLAGIEEQQLSIITTLSGEGYMNTSHQNGTGTTGMLRGIERISSSLFEGNYQLSYQGWRKHPKRYSTGITVPQLDFMQQHISEHSAVWLNIGWYKINSNDDHVRMGGHWVTLVGYVGDQQLILHDPSPRAGEAFANEYVDLVPITSGRLTGKKMGLPVSALGYWSLGKGMHIKSGADVAVIDGVIGLGITE